MTRNNTGRASATSATSPLRRCIVTGQTFAPPRLIRFVASRHADGDSVVLPDIGNRLPGRGAWVVAEYAVLQQAIRTGRLLKVLSGKRLADDLLLRVDQLLAARCQQQLSMGRRAGLVIGGGGTIRAASKTKAIDWLLVADDASPREAESLIATSKPKNICRHFSSGELGAVFKRPSLAFAAVFASNNTGYSSRLGDELLRFAGIRHP